MAWPPLKRHGIHRGTQRCRSSHRREGKTIKKTGEKSVTRAQVANQKTFSWQKFTHLLGFFLFLLLFLFFFFFYWPCCRYYICDYCRGSSAAHHVCQQHGRPQDARHHKARSKSGHQSIDVGAKDQVQVIEKKFQELIDGIIDYALYIFHHAWMAGEGERGVLRSMGTLCLFLDYITANLQKKRDFGLFSVVIYSSVH